jgi:oligopeptide/dipeptide ABC transporter ATP-binding protein
MASKEKIFQVQNLRMWFPIKKGLMKKTVGHVKAVDDVSLDVYKGETLGIVGESGCGKSTFGKTIMMLNRPTGGQVLFNYGGAFKDITQFTPQELFQFRKKVQMVFQDPYSALNPLKKIYTSFEEPLKVHGVRSSKEREQIMQEVLRMVNIQPDYLMRYPHEFSGGQRQRLCIARALEVHPEVLVCDEPVSALDVSIQAQVLNLMKKIQKEMDLTYLFIAHDLSVVQYMSDRIVVMYLGKIVEVADSRELYDKPLHPYTRALLSAIPVPDIHREKKRIVLQGEVPSPIHKPSGCAFHPRCPHCMEICRQEDPALCRIQDSEHLAACLLYDK